MPATPKLEFGMPNVRARIGLLGNGFASRSKYLGRNRLDRSRRRGQVFASTALVCLAMTSAVLLQFRETLAATPHELTGLAVARAKYGFRGNGQTGAVIDTGIAYDHVALGGGLGPGFRVVGGRDFTAENGADPSDHAPDG